jgi:hypothetical protein
MGKGTVAPEGSSRNTAKLVGTFSAPVPLCLGDVYVSKRPVDARMLVCALHLPVSPPPPTASKG